MFGLSQIVFRGSEEFSSKVDDWLEWSKKVVNKVCPYCRTNPQKHHCVNCGAPQEFQ